MGAGRRTGQQNTGGLALVVTFRFRLAWREREGRGDGLFRAGDGTFDSLDLAQSPSPGHLPCALEKLHSEADSFR